MRSRKKSGSTRSMCARRSSTEALLTAAVLAALAASAPAQRQFEAFARRGLPPDSDDTRAMVLGDVDRDGDLDLIVGNPRSQSRLYLNDGTGSFTDATAAHLPVDIAGAAAVALGDVDGDGDLDLVVADGHARLLLNDGTGTFTDPARPQITAAADRIALGDVDGDGDLDLVCGIRSHYEFFFLRVPGRKTLYLNDGAGIFTAAPQFAGDEDTLAMVLGDVDGDGDLDLICGNVWFPYNWGPVGFQNSLYLNNGSGKFGDVTAASLPATYDRTVALALGDLDGDGDLDLVVGNWEIPNWYPGNRLLLNDGAGVFMDAPDWRMPSVPATALVLGDMDGDGDLDMFACQQLYGSTPVMHHLYLNDGTGTFADVAAARLLVDLDFVGAVALGDLDSDGDLDMVVGHGGNPWGWWETLPGQNRLYFNLLRQLNAPSAPAIGRAYTLDVYARYGPTCAVTMALPFVSPVPSSIPCPPIGTIGIDPTQAIVLPPLFIPQPAGVASLSIPVPNDQGLVGLSIYSQALIVPYPFQAHLTNVTTGVVIR